MFEVTGDPPAAQVVSTTVALVSDALTPLHPSSWYIDHLQEQGARFADAIDRGPLDAGVDACPGWHLTNLAEHLGQIHRWATYIVLHGGPPTGDDDRPEPDRDHLADWYRDSLSELVEALEQLDPDGPTWHPFPVDQLGRVWPRRQAHETAMHRWDAERAIGDSSAFDPELASDGIDEYFEITIPRLMVREGLRLPAGSLHVHCTDVEGEWLVWSEQGEYRVKRAHEKGDAALRGPAEAILLRLWGRSSPLIDQLSPVGDEQVLDRWLEIAGM